MGMGYRREDCITRRFNRARNVACSLDSLNESRRREDDVGAIVGTIQEAYELVPLRRS